MILLISCSSNWQSSKGDRSRAQVPVKLQRSNTGLKIECKPTRGQPYSDPLGKDYQLRLIPASITNDSTIPIQVQLAFSKDYDYPKAYHEEPFKVFPMPEAWALDGVETTDRMLEELPKYIDRPTINRTLEPGEKFVLALGTIHPSDIKYGVFPVALFSHDNRTLQHECDRLLDPDTLPIPDLALELLIGFTGGSQASPDRCTTIPCGQIGYPGQ